MADANVRDQESLVWKQFKKRPIGVFSLYVIMALFAVAIFAPLLANQNPIALYTTHGVLYEYYWSGWQSVHDITARGVAERDALRKQEADALASYDAERDTIKALVDKYNAVGNSYDAARDEADRLQERIDVVSAWVAAGGIEPAAGCRAEQTHDVAALNVELEKLKGDLVLAVEARKKVGGEKAQVKAEMDAHRAAQDTFNLAIRSARFRLDFAAQGEAVLLNISKMAHFVDDETAGRLRALHDRYADLYTRVQADGGAAGLSAEFDALEAEAVATVAPDKISDRLEYRLTFPVLAAMDTSDRFFAVTYPVFVVLLLLRRRVRGSVTEKLVGAAAVGLVAALVLPVLSLDLPQRNYQDILLDNVKAGQSESWALMPPVAYGMNENRFQEQLQPPSFVQDAAGRSGLHLLGTDDTGRDVMSRMIWGARVSLSVGFVAVGLHLVIGIILGAMAGFFGGKVDMLLSRIMEIVICFPSFFLILTAISIVGPSIYNVMIVIGLTGWTGIARLTRAEFLRLRGQDFVVAAQAAGYSEAAVMFKHVLPNAMTPVMVSAAFGFAGAILVESGLSFLGFGVQEPFPSWGQMLADSRSDPLNLWWLFIVPGVALFLTVTFYNLAGNTFRDASDPRLRK